MFKLSKGQIIIFTLGSISLVIFIAAYVLESHGIDRIVLLFFLIVLGLITAVAIIIILISKFIARLITGNNKNESKNMKLNTSYDFYYIVSRLGEDHQRDEIIVHSKGRNHPNCVLYIQKHNLGMKMIIKNSDSEIIFEKDKVTVNEAALKFQEFWEKPYKYKKSKNSNVKKKPPLVFK